MTDSPKKRSNHNYSVTHTASRKKNGYVKKAPALLAASSNDRLFSHSTVLPLA
jgi:hypothetical protein